MPKWELLYHWVPVGATSHSSTKGDSTIITVAPTWSGDDFKKAWSEAQSFANDGWELVSVAPETKAFAQMWKPLPDDTVFRELDHGRLGQSYAYGISYTAGYMFIFKRPRA